MAGMSSDAPARRVTHVILAGWPGHQQQQQQGAPRSASPGQDQQHELEGAFSLADTRQREASARSGHARLAAPSALGTQQPSPPREARRDGTSRAQKGCDQPCAPGTRDVTTRVLPERPAESLRSSRRTAGAAAGEGEGEGAAAVAGARPGSRQERAACSPASRGEVSIALNIA